MLCFSLAHFSSFAFCRMLLCYFLCWLSPFCFAFFISFYQPLGVFPFGSFIFVFRFLCHSTFTPSHPCICCFFCQFHYRVVCLCVQCPFCSFYCVFHFWPLLLFLAFGISWFYLFGPWWATRCQFVCARV